MDTDFGHSVPPRLPQLDFASARFLRFRTAVATTSLAAAMIVGGIPLRAQQAVCQPHGKLVQLRDVPEASGLTVSRRVRGRLWTHNDSGQPVLFALNESGEVTGRLRITGAAVDNWEAVASAQCGNEVCLYIADIGDNSAKRDHVTIYRVPEPAGTEQSSAQAAEIRATYPDGAQDAETLLVTSDGRLHIVTKGSTGAIALYRFPATLRPESVVQLERVGAPNPAKTDRDSNITDGAISVDGQWAVLRSHDALLFFRASDLLAGHWQSTFRVDITPLREPQGEGVALDGNNTVFLSGEGGEKSREGTFSSFACALRD